MTPVVKQEQESGQGRYVELFAAAIAGGNTGFMFSLLGALNWQECFILMFSLAALAAGAVFTFFEMRALN